VVTNNFGVGKILDLDGGGNGADDNGIVGKSFRAVPKMIQRPRPIQALFAPGTSYHTRWRPREVNEWLATRWPTGMAIERTIPSVQALPPWKG